MNDNVQVARSGGISFLTFPRFADFKAVRHAISTRLGGVSGKSFGSLNLSYKVGDEVLKVSENRFLFEKAFGSFSRGLVYPQQIHSDIVLPVGRDDLKTMKPGEPWKEGDALMTNEKNVTLLILVADCLPVFFYDPVHQAIGLAHAGWRGTVTHIAPKTLLAMSEAYGTQPAEVKVALGPSIGACCYEVGQDVKGQFDEIFPWSGEVFTPSFGKQWKLDLAQANVKQLLDIGVTEDHLTRSNLCTVEHRDLFYSHRAEASSLNSTGRFGAFLMLAD